MPARYGKFGTGIENWKPNNDKTLWVHKINSLMRVFIRPNANPKEKAKYQVYHSRYSGGGTVIDSPYEYADTMKEAREIARKRLTQFNNPLYW